MTMPAPTAANGTTKTKPPSPQELLKSTLETNSKAFSAILPKHVTVERVIKVVLSATARNPDLLKCTRQSFVLAVMQAAELGLEIGGLLGEAYLVPFKHTWTDSKGQHEEQRATCIVGYRGLINLARRSGQIHSIGARVVHQRDVFHVDLAGESIQHHPDLGDDPGPLVAVYAIARFKDGGQQVEVMTRGQVNAIKDRSPAGKSGPWITDFDEMARKTVVRRLAKYLPLSPELARAIEHENDVDSRGAGFSVREAPMSLESKLEARALSEATPPHDPVTGEIVAEAVLVDDANGELPE